MKFIDYSNQKLDKRKGIYSKKMSPDNSNTSRNYELLAILAGSLKESEQKKELEKWETEISKIGKIKNKTVWENRPLAYKIKQEITGTYLICEFEASAENIKEFAEALRLDSKIIRHILYLTPKHYAWKEYAAEDLEHDLSKIKPKTEAAAPKKAFAKKFKAPTPAKKLNAEKAPSQEETKPKKVAEIDAKKLDDLLGEL